MPSIDTRNIVSERTSEAEPKGGYGEAGQGKTLGAVPDPPTVKVNNRSRYQVRKGC